MKKIFGLLILVALMVSCGSKKRVFESQPTSTQKTTSDRALNVDKDKSALVKKSSSKSAIKSSNEKPTFTSPVEAYIWEYAGVAQEEMKLYGIPASIKMAQGILESGSANGNLASRSNNHFGIKCSDWEGERVYHDDDELQECFRKYVDPKYSYRDHSLFLYERSRYAFLFDYEITDYKAWARGLRRAGYATDKKYPDKLISLIERYKLYELDQEVVDGTPPTYFPKPDNRVNYESQTYVVQKGDTLYKVATKYNLTVEELKKINGLRSDNLSIGQELILKIKN
ncbi:glucosaminidase domain-containing protein [Psychroflexus maritimus]|uniref:Peptidoglycan hydrolase n=1 Tax=Psychroflexus maritimus TaxID=2714865 RepID=A0A967AHV1_9FLAO|nr:glucosaminidase domain-containing protein [Psychroflexus maritimus]NGZ89640.1 LysM peptidoglycan-binding domain-containing protein [Psychroflexus maritimus]